MPTNYWLGDALAVAQVTTLTVGGTPTTGQIFTISVGAKSVTYTTLAAATTATITTALQALLAATTIREFQEVVWTSPTSTTIRATAATAGVPFTITIDNGTGTGTITPAATTASAGPKHYDTPKNWSLGTVPTTTHDVVIQNSSSEILYGVNTGNTINSHVIRNFSGVIGLPDVNSSGYREYRDRFLILNIVGSTPTCEIGENVTSSRMRISLDATPAAVRVLSTGFSQSANQKALELVGIGTATSVDVLKGSIQLGGNAEFPSDSITLRIGSESVSGQGASLTIGSDVTVTSCLQYGGDADSSGTIASLVMGKNSGTWLQRFNPVTTMNVYSGVVTYLSEGTIATANLLSSDATLDRSQSIAPLVITNCKVIGGAKLLDPAKSITYTNPIVTDRASLLVMDLGDTFSIQRS